MTTHGYLLYVYLHVVSLTIHRGIMALGPPVRQPVHLSIYLSLSRSTWLYIGLAISSLVHECPLSLSVRTGRNHDPSAASRLLWYAWTSMHASRYTAVVICVCIWGTSSPRTKAVTPVRLTWRIAVSEDSSPPTHPSPVQMLSIISQVEQNYSFQPLQWGEASSGGDRQTARSAAAAGSPVLRPETSSIRLFLREQRRSKGITYTYTYTGARALRPWPCTVYLIVICQLVPSVLVVLTVLLLLFPFACWMRRVYLRRRLRAILIAQHRLHASESFSLQHTSLAAAIYPGTSTIDLAHLLVREVLLFRRRCIGVLPSWWLCRLARDVDEVDTLCHDLLLDTSIRVHTARLDDQNFWWIEETDNQIAAPSPIRQIQQTAEDIASSPGAGGACSPLQPPSPGMDEAMEYSNAQRDLLMQLANEPRDRLSPLAGSVSVPGASYFLGNENAFNQYGEPRYSLHGNPFHSQGDSLLRRSSAHESARRLAESMNPGTAALHGSRAPTGWQTGGLDPPYGGIEPCQVPVGGGNRKSFFAVGDTPCEGLTRTSRLPTLMERASNIASQGLLNARTSAGGTRVAPKRGSSLVAGVKDYSHAAFLALADRHAGERQSVVAGREAGSGVKQKVYSTVEPYAHDSWRASTRGFLGAVPGDGNTRASRSAGRRATGYVGSFIGMGNSGAN